MNSVLSFKGVSKYFFSNKVLDSLTFDLKPGHFNVLAGANGAGKSTLLCLAAGLDRFDTGEIHVFGRDLNDHLDDPKHTIGFVSESVQYQFPTNMKGLLEIQREIAPQWDQTKAERLAVQFGLELTKDFRDVSRGQKMQFAFIMAICMKPHLLILDEITAVLDPSARAIVVKEVREFANGSRTAIMATNIMTEAQRYADRILILDQGRIWVDSPANKIGSGYSKIRVNTFENDPVMNARSVGQNADGTISLIVPSNLLTDGVTSDRRVITAEEVFIYHTRKGA